MLHSHSSPLQIGHIVAEAVTGLLQEPEVDGEALQCETWVLL